MDFPKYDRFIFVAVIFSVATLYASFPLNTKEQDEVRSKFVAAI